LIWIGGIGCLSGGVLCWAHDNYWYKISFLSLSL
jgi:hypothetical protein